MLESLRSVVSLKPIERDATKRRLGSAANIEDLRAIAKKRLPAGVFDYIDGAAEDELAMARNASRFSDRTLVPRVLRDVTTIDASVEILGRPAPMPLIIAPTGFPRIAHPEGELATARAAAAHGIPFSLSTMGTRSIEEVADVSNGPKWYQVYVWRDRELTKDMLERCKARGYEALYITVDTAVLGRRERDVRRGMTLPPKIGLDTFIEGAMRPAWVWEFLRAEPIVFSNVAVSTARLNKGTEDGASAVTLAEYVNSQFDPGLSWDDVAWIRSQWGGPVILKGIQSVADAKIAASEGIEAIALSNHGGRQLDASPAIIDLVAPVADAVGGQTEIYCDGGVRRGSDVVKAIALGATACMIGRPHLYALAAGGEAGVNHMLDFFQSGIEQTMALTGVAAIADIDRSAINDPH
ncbi:MAG: alpha-hydroxy-acid oxidizing protein [Acidimicrobiales bacterium]|nr:alpha-hydroxy-acid oxidizing protein [Acidimicrobiales bacterium]